MHCKPIQWRLRSGFTLVELATVIGVLGILSVVTITSYSAFRRQAWTSEAVANVYAISSLEKGRVGGPIVCPPFPTEVPSASTLLWHPSAGFDQLGFSPGTETRFQYEVHIEDPGDGRFLVRARGDLDGDGETSLFELWSDEVDIRTERELE